MATYKKSIDINASSELEASTIAVYLKTMAKHLNAESLAILAEKSSKAGINQRIKDYKSFI